MTRTALFSPVELIDGDRRKGIVILADHAGREIPEEFGTLGLPSSEFDRHIAYDIGVAGVTRRLAKLTGAPAVMARFSRLLIDPNRGEDDPTLVRQLYDGTVIATNYPMSAADREARLAGYYRPYHDAVAALVASVTERSGKAPFLFSVHSFTPRMQGVERPWHAGVLWDRDDRAVGPLLEALRSEPSLVVGDNEPYDGALRGDSMHRHATAKGYAHALLEIRQDLIAEESGQEEWARRLAPVLEAINTRPDMHEIKFFGSRTGPMPGPMEGYAP